LCHLVIWYVGALVSDNANAIFSPHGCSETTKCQKLKLGVTSAVCYEDDAPVFSCMPLHFT